jgi:hypothetical protein
VVRHLLTPGPGISFLGANPGQSALLAQAEALDACQVSWSAGSVRGAVSCPDVRAAIRWEVLTGLTPFRPGQPVDVLVVDQADRRPTPELSGLARAAVHNRAHLVFVEGGTLPRLTSPASRGLMDAADRTGRLSCGSHLPWGGPAGREAMLSLTGRSRVHKALRRWLDARASGAPAILVGLGVEEVRGLNLAARSLLMGGRPGVADWVPGERVTVLRGRAGPPGYGTFGSIVDLDGMRPRIRWDGEASPTSYAPEVFQQLGYGYAATVPVAARSGRPVVLLGPAGAAPALEARVPGTLDKAKPGLVPAMGLAR